MLVAPREAHRLEVRPVRQRLGDLGPEGFHAEIVPPDLAVVRVLQDLGFEGGFEVDACSDSDLDSGLDLDCRGTREGERKS